jgi:hypothetical protein
MATLKLKIRRIMKIFTNAGSASLKENLIGLRLKLIILFTISIFVSGCSEFALLASAGSVAASQNAYKRIYSGVDVLTIMSTEKDIKTHVYENAKDLYDKTKY